MSESKVTNCVAKRDAFYNGARIRAGQDVAIIGKLPKWAVEKEEPKAEKPKAKTSAKKEAASKE